MRNMAGKPVAVELCQELREEDSAATGQGGTGLRGVLTGEGKADRLTGRVSVSASESSRGGMHAFEIDSELQFRQLDMFNG